MYKKKPSADNHLFATENEFHTLLAIHNEIKKSVYKMFPYIKEQIIETLFSILSSQALLYDQIIRKSVLLQGSITKETQITKLVQGNKISFEKKIQEHLNSFNTNYEYPSETKTGVTTSQGKLTNVSKEDSLFIEQESIFSKLKKKINSGKEQHIRTNSARSHYKQFDTEEEHHQQQQHYIQKKPKRKLQPPLTEKKELRNINKRNILSHNKKQIVFSKDKQIIKYSNNNIDLYLDKDKDKDNDNYRSNTQDSFNFQQQPQGKRSALSRTMCLTERKNSNSDKDFFATEFKLYPLLSYQSFPLPKERKLRRMRSKPTKYTKYLLKKYRDVVDSYEKFETEEDDMQRQSLFHSQILSRTDFNKKTSEIQNTTQSFIITDYNKSKNKSKPKTKPTPSPNPNSNQKRKPKKSNRNTSCGSRPKQKSITNSIINNAWK